VVYVFAGNATGLKALSKPATASLTAPTLPPASVAAGAVTFRPW